MNGSTGLASLTALSSDDSGSFTWQATRTYSNSLQAKIFFFSQAQLHCCHTMFLQEKQHSITIFKSNVIHHGYTVVAVLGGNHLIKEHGSKVGGLYFTEGKENSTNKPYKTTLHTTESEKQLAQLASLIMHSTPKIEVKLESHHLSWKHLSLFHR